MHQVQLVVKRLFDILVCLLIGIVFLPFLILIAILVKLSSPGPVFFTQDRLGMNQKAFQMIKFRTMTGRPTNESATIWTAAEEARITPIGRFLRDYGLDEFPQLLNILKGDMSIVGPRPPLPTQIENYTDLQRRVFHMRPGVVSLAAVRGRRSIPIEQRIELHVAYVDNWSLWLDWTILWQSLVVVLFKKDASEIL